MLAARVPKAGQLHILVLGGDHRWARIRRADHKRFGGPVAGSLRRQVFLPLRPQRQADMAGTGEVELEARNGEPVAAWPGDGDRRRQDRLRVVGDVIQRGPGRHRPPCCRR